MIGIAKRTDECEERREERGRPDREGLHYSAKKPGARETADDNISLHCLRVVAVLRVETGKERVRE